MQNSTKLHDSPKIIEKLPRMAMRKRISMQDTSNLDDVVNYNQNS